MGRVLLIGGPSDGQEIDGPTGAAVLDIEGSRYVLRRAGGGHPDEVRGWVGIFLPLHAGVLKAQFARWVDPAHLAAGPERAADRELIGDLGQARRG